MKRGLLPLPPEMIGYIITLAIFVGIMAMIAMFWFNFQTIPTETPEKATACDLAYMLSTWKDLTVYPNIFNKTLLNEWKTTGGREETANSIFENMSKFFLPDSDYFMLISDGSDVYSLYVPPESKSVYKKCGNLKISEKDYKKLDEKLQNYITKSGNIDYIEGKPGELPHNKLSSICPLTTFVADKDNVEIGAMVTGLTTNLATQLRDGIYQVGVKGKPHVFYRLGPYPEGCLVNGGTNERKSKTLIKDILTERIILKLPVIGGAIGDIDSWIDEAISSIPLVGDLYDWLKGKKEEAIEWMTTTEVYAKCGFKWDFNNTTNVLSVIPSSKGEGDCELKTRIPRRVVNESNLSAKICRPKEAYKHTITGPGGLYDLEFFLLVENVRESWTAENTVKFCKDRCEIDTPWYISPKICKKYCEYEGKCISLPCDFAKSQRHLFNNMLEGAINIKYIVVETEKLEDKSIDEIIENNEAYAIVSACDSWPTVSECGRADICEGPHCVDFGEGRTCTTCSGHENAFCSPNYLENPPSVKKWLYTCQEVLNQSWPSREEMSECLPVILVNRTFNGEEIDSINCPENEDAEVTWKINASGLCCENLTKTEKGLFVCEEDTGFCPKMKLWPNLNSSNVAVLDDKNYVFSITQKVCRGEYSYNNAEKAFIVVHYPVKDKIIEYSLEDSRIELKGPIEPEKQCDKVSVGETLKDGNCIAKVKKLFKNWARVRVEYGEYSHFEIDKVYSDGSKLFHYGRCKVTYDKPKACIYEKTPGPKNELIIKIGEAITDCYHFHYADIYPSSAEPYTVICDKIDVSGCPKVYSGHIQQYIEDYDNVPWKWKIANPGGGYGAIPDDSGDEVCINYTPSKVKVLPGSECPGSVYEPPSKGESDCKELKRRVYALFKSGDCEMKAKRKTPVTKDELYIYWVKYDDDCGVEEGEIDKGTHIYCGGKCKVNNTADEGRTGPGSKEACLTDIS